MSDPETLRVYAGKASDYAEMIAPVARKDPQLAAFIKAVPAGGEVLDLGCGPGHYAAEMAKAGLRVTATDPVPEMVALAGQFQGVTAQRASFSDLTGTNLYDGVWANFSLLHAPRTDMPRHLSQISAALRPGGIFHIGVKTGSGETRDSLGRLYTYYSVDELSSLLRDAGFTVMDQVTGIDAGLSGEVAPWVCLRCHA